MPFAPVPDCLQSSAEPFGNRLHVHCELPLSAAGAYMRKAQEVEGCRFLPPLPCVPGCVASEFNQPRLLRVQCPRKETSCGGCFEIVAIPYVQASWFVRHPGLPYLCADPPYAGQL